jgi:hypothetical protein
VAAWYSQTMPLTPAGSVVAPVAEIPTGLGTVIPSAVPTLAAVGHEAGAGVVAGLASATGVTEAMVGIGVEVLELELPHAAMVATTTRARGASNGMFRRCTDAILLVAGRVVRFVANCPRDQSTRNA